MSDADFSCDMFQDFLSPFFSPALKLSSQGRNSGGVVVLVKTFLKDYVTELKFDMPNCITLKLCNLFYKDIICIFPYVPCSSSPFYKNFEEKNGITILERHISDLTTIHNDCCLLLMGDLNARMSNIQPLDDCSLASKYTDDINSLSFFNDFDKSFTRQSKDAAFNAFGKPLIDLCASFNLIVLNGFGNGDQNGEFTFISPNGNSVIDYCIVSEDLLSCDMLFKVENRVESWHMPLTFEIEFLSNAFTQEIVLKNNYKKPKWIEENVCLFNQEWTNSDCTFNVSNLCNIVKNNPLYATDCISAFSDLLNNCAHMMSRLIYVNKSPKLKNTWFDDDCLKIKRLTRRHLRKYQSTGLLSDKIDYISSRNRYKTLLKNKKRNFSIQKTNSLLSNMKNSRLFWKEIKNICPKNHAKINIKLTEWFDHFESIFCKNNVTPPICFEPDNRPLTVSADSVASLNTQFLLSELVFAIRNCSVNKAPGPDCLLNELFKHTQNDCSDFILTAFNVIFDNHEFPNAWSHSNIVPIFKKGDINSCDNYRPIWLTSLFSKLYTYILNKRLKQFTLDNNIIPEEQAGFREGYSTTDHIFTLYSMIMLQFSKNKKLYVCFVDYKKAFDSINRQALFKILEANGINGKFLDAIKSIYQTVSASVSVDGLHSNTFYSSTGLKQGCLLSPNLFSLFMTEVSKALNADGVNGISFQENLNVIFHLLFADDILLVSDSIRGLQNQLDILYFQSQRLGLEINNEKTQIVIFRKGGFVSKYEKWSYGNTNLKIVNSYRYLGFEFTSKLSFNNAVRPFIAKAKKACFDISKSLSSIECYSLDVFSKLFDSKVAPILTYACELWGMHDINEVERVHTNSFKRFLNVSIHCSNMTLYADTGRLPLCITLKLRCVKYWLRLINMNDKRLSKQAYNRLYTLSEQGLNNWVTNVKHVLESNGFGIVWLFKGVGNESLFLNDFKIRLIDCYKQSWHAKISTSENFSTFYSFKSVILKESFL